MRNIDFYKSRFLMFVIDKMAFELEKKGKNIIRMTLGKSELPMHTSIIKAYKKNIDNFDKSSLVFPSGLPELKEKISDVYNKKYAINIESENIIVSVGTSSLFRNLYEVILNFGDEILIPRPYYSLYKFCGLLMNAKIKYYDINSDDLCVDMESFKKNYSSRTKIVVINSPGNPLGNILTREEFIEIDEIVNGKSYIISDEIYINMGFDETPISALNVFGWGSESKSKSKFIYTNSLSKGYRMYSRRVGWCIVPEELIIPLTVVQHHTLLTADPVGQFAAIEALNHPGELEYLRDIYKKRRDYTINKFKNILDVHAINSKGSFYITLNCMKYIKKNNILNELELAKEIINTTGVATVPGSDFGLPNTLRLSYTCERYNDGIDKLYKFFKR